MATRTHMRRCAGCPKMIVVPVRGGRRYCADCAEVARVARRAQVREGQDAREQSRANARRVVHEELSIFDRERIILGWLREG